MHESTVSRVVNHKYMHTPRGVFEMRFFFHSGLGSNRADAVSSLTVKERIGRMIADEDPNKPLSDQTIAETLRREGVDIARRTVAKYRKELKIASSTQRKRAR
jgi:RNA polymerase sigma-54 factor